MNDDLAQLYLKTVVSIEEEGVLVPARVASLLVDGIVHVLTAWNPGSSRPAREVNDSANAQLFSDLVACGLEPVRAVGADPDSEHVEESWAVVGWSDDEAREIGRRFGQVAVFRFEAGLQTVVACFEDWTVSRPIRT